ncbi:unnamed protein product [Brassica rapa]|uniref:Uncharacterized protein n=1 Tax=Brassica campestris TaxID=3711 RepID=A0A8D9DF24_BRACM|nr:unnamed protein product [Brassica rapa]
MDCHGRPVHGHPVYSHGQPWTSCVCWRTPTDVLCVLNRQPTWAKITQTVPGKGQRVEPKDQRADMCTNGQPLTSCTDTHGHTQTATDVLCVLADTDRRHVHTRTHTDSHGRPACVDGQPRTAIDVLCALAETHGRPVYSPRGPKSPKQSTGRASVRSPRTNVLICVLMDRHGCPVCADGHRRTHTDSHRRPMCAGGHPQTLPTWAKITRTVHGKGQRAESKDQHAYMSTDVLCVLTDTHGHTQTAPDVLCVLTDTHGRPPHKATDVIDSPRGPKSPKQSTGRASVLSPRTSVLICVLMDSHGRPVCADGHTQTHTDVLCVLTDTHGYSHGRPVCADGQPQTSCVRWRTPTDVLCVLNRQPTWAKITQTVHGKGQRAESKNQHTDVLCVLTDKHGQPQTSCPNTHGHTRTATDVLCVLADTHGRPVQPTWAKITRTVHGKVHMKGQRAESKDQRADMCTDGQPRTSYTHGHTRIATYVLCVLMDSHGEPQTSCVCWQTPADFLYVLNIQPTWAKITQTVHGKGQRAESRDQRADMCTDGQPRTSYSPQGPKSPEQSTGRVNVLSPRTNVLICVLMDSHRCYVCADGHTRTHTDSHRRPVQPTWAKIIVHGKGQRAESKDQRSDICTDGQPRTSCTNTHGHTRTATDVLCVLADTHGRPVCTDQTAHPRMSCMCWRTPTNVLCVLTRQSTWAKITRTVHGKGQRAESKDQRADMCTDGQPQTSCVHTRTAPNVQCVLMDTHGRPVCADGHPRTSYPMWAKITRTVHGKGQRAESKNQRADMCTDGHPQTSCVCWRTPTDVLCVLNRQPMWAKIIQTVHGKGQRADSKDQLQRNGQRAESKDQRADMCTDGQPRTSCVCGMAHMDTHRRPVCADGNTRTSCVGPEPDP